MNAPKPDCYDYVRRHYGVPAYIGVDVKVRMRGSERDGVIVAPKHPDQYVHVFVEGERRVESWHPLEVAYCPIAPREAGSQERRRDVGLARRGDTMSEITARQLADACEFASECDVTEALSEMLMSAAARLRQTCATCQHWDAGDEITIAHCRKGQDAPFSGSGYCHKWKAKP